MFLDAKDSYPHKIYKLADSYCAYHSTIRVHSITTVQSNIVGLRDLVFGCTSYQTHEQEYETHF
jgi:hypothetical protein